MQVRVDAAPDEPDLSVTGGTAPTWSQVVQWRQRVRPAQPRSLQLMHILLWHSHTVRVWIRDTPDAENEPAGNSTSGSLRLRATTFEFSYASATSAGAHTIVAPALLAFLSQAFICGAS